ncbi:hypothetical protein UlMin_007863 [Ulmus minor]
METIFHYIIIFSLFLLSLLFLFIRSRNPKNLKSIPSPPRLPIIGNLHQLGTHPHRSLKALSRKYGPIMFLQLGHVPTIVITSADIVREIFQTHDVVFSNRPKTTAAQILLYGGQDVGFAQYGEQWRQSRKICVLELLSFKMVQQFQHVREEEVALLVDRIREACFNGSSVNLSEMLIATNNNIVCKCTLGKSFVEEDGRSSFGELSRTVMVYLMAFCVGDFFPYLRWIDVLRGFNRRLKRTFRALDQLFDEVIEQHEAVIESDDGSNMANILLRFQKDAGKLDFEFTRDNLKAILLDMFLGGTDTASATLEWMMAELMRNPKVMKKVQEEVRRVVGKKPMIEPNHINQMEYLKCVVKETLRLRSPVPLLAPRETLTSVDMGGYHIPAKTRVLVNAWAIQRDPSLWDEPEEFIPERFENRNVDFKGLDFELIPFGFGRRGCPAISFGIAAVECVIANLLYWFDWKLADVDVQSLKELDMDEVYGLTVHKKVSLNLVPKINST